MSRSIIAFAPRHSIRHAAGGVQRGIKFIPSEHRRVIGGLKDRRRQMHAGQRNAEFVLCDASAQRQARCGDDDAAAAIKVGGDIEHRPEVSRGPLEDRFGAAKRMPEVAIGGELAIFLGRAELDELQAGVVDQRLEIPIGRDGDLMAALAQANADADKRMDIAMRAESEEKDVHGCGYREAVQSCKFRNKFQIGEIRKDSFAD